STSSRPGRPGSGRASSASTPARPWSWSGTTVGSAATPCTSTWPSTSWDRSAPPAGWATTARLSRVCTCPGPGRARREASPAPRDGPRRGLSCPTGPKFCAMAHAPLPDANDFTARIVTAYASKCPAVELGKAMLGGAVLPDAVVQVPAAMCNRHGLIAGATGTGKTKTLQLMAEQLSAMGVPVFAADVKGDLSGLSRPGEVSDRVPSRVEEMKLESSPAGLPVTFLSLGGPGPGVTAGGGGVLRRDVDGGVRPDPLHTRGRVRRLLPGAGRGAGQAQALLHLPHVDAGRVVPRPARGGRPRQAQARLLLRRGPPPVARL